MPKSLMLKPHHSALILLLVISSLESTHDCLAAVEPPENSGISITESLTYTLTPEPTNQLIRVELSWKTAGRRESVISIAKNWASVKDPSLFLNEITFEGIEQSEVIENTWKLSHAEGALINCSYSVSTGHRSFDWGRHYYPITTRRFFNGIGHTFLITPDVNSGHVNLFNTTVKWILPTGWNNAVSSFGEGETSTGIMTALDVRQSVYLAGSLDVKTGMVNGKPVTVAMHGLFHFDAEEFFDTASKIIITECSFMNEKDFPPYVITVIPVGDPLRRGSTRFSGTGLYNSFAMFLPPVSKLDANIKYLLAHELFHHWNGRVLDREEPEQLVYWVSEGFTDYFAFQMLMKTFPDMTDELAKRLNRTIKRYLNNPAIHASNSEIRMKFWNNRETFGDIPYQRGFLLALRWNYLAKKNGINEGIHGWFKSLVERGRTDNYLLSNPSIRATGIEMLGEWFGEEFDRFVDGKEIVEVPLDALEPQFTATDVEIYEFELGFDFDESRDEGHVVGVLEDSAAYNAGLRDKDVLYGWNIQPDDPDYEVSLKVKRGNGEAQDLKYLPRRVLRTQPKFKPAEKD